MGDIDESDLIERLKAGDRAAFRELVENHKKTVYRLAFDLTGNHLDAEDVSQDVFIRVFRHIQTFREGARLGSWLYRITVNASRDHHRRKPREARAASSVSLSADRAPDLETAAWSDQPEKSGDAVLLQARIDRALAAVSKQEREAFVLRHYEELDLKSIAEAMDVSVGSVKSYLFRGIRKVRKELAGMRGLAPSEVRYE